MAVTMIGGGDRRIWEAVAQQASIWRKLPVVQEYAKRLPQNSAYTSDGVPGLLQKMISGAAALGSKPLEMDTSMRHLLALFPDVPPDLQGDLYQWLGHAELLEEAHRATVGWLRSRLPRYPMLLAPQLGRDTALTTMEFTDRLTWRKREMGAGLQFENPPVRQLQALGASDVDVTAACAAVRRVLSALMESKEWRNFVEADASLGPGDTDALTRARRQVGESLGAARFDAFEPTRALRRADFRNQVVRDIVKNLPDAARAYAWWFDAVDSLIEFACSRVFGQLVVYGPVRLQNVSELAADGPEAQTVEFVIDSMRPLPLGTICWLNDPLFPEAVMLTGLSMSFSQVDGMRQVARGRLLNEAALAWKQLEL